MYKLQTRENGDGPAGITFCGKLQLSSQFGQDWPSFNASSHIGPPYGETRKMRSACVRECVSPDLHINSKNNCEQNLFSY